MRLKVILIPLLAGVAASAQIINPQLNPQPQVDQLQQAIQQQQQQLQLQQSLQSQQVQQQTQQLQLQRQTEQMIGAVPSQPGVPGARFGVPAGRWWYRAGLVNRIGLSTEQQKKMDDVYQQARLRMIDLTAAFEKEQTLLEPMTMAEQPDEAKIVAQIDRVGQARVEVEKANARMMLEIRGILTSEQWAKLKLATTGD